MSQNTLKTLMPNHDWQNQNLENTKDIGNITFNHFCLDSRFVNPDEAFILLKSAVNHEDNKSLAYAQQASKKAALILSEIDLTPSNIDVPWQYIPNIRDLLGQLQHNLLFTKNISTPNLKATKPNVIAVTGTNGKTTIASLTAQLLSLINADLLGFNISQKHHTEDALTKLNQLENYAGLGNALGIGIQSSHTQPDDGEPLKKTKVAVLGTTGNGIWPDLQDATHTTADVLQVQQFYYDLTQAGADIFCIEASSHGLHQQRLQAMPITTAIYTNLSRDHLDYHHTMADYAQAKALLFAWQGLQHGIINADDAYAPVMLKVLQSNQACAWLYSMNNSSDTVHNHREHEIDFLVTAYRPHLSGVSIDLTTPFGAITLESPLLGQFNIANLVAAVAATLATICQNHNNANQSNDDNPSDQLDFANILASIAKAVTRIKGATGRMQSIHHDGCQFIIDYAHTPDALAQSISSLRMHQSSNHYDKVGNICTVFGCGGDRDRGKRPLMTQAALASDKVIITADNPRTENVHAIIDDMLAGITTEQRQKIIIEPDRKKAIALAIDQASTADMILIAGKGHETYQEIDGVRYDFDDMVVLKSLL